MPMTTAREWAKAVMLSFFANPTAISPTRSATAPRCKNGRIALNERAASTNNSSIDATQMRTVLSLLAVTMLLPSGE